MLNAKPARPKADDEMRETTVLVLGGRGFIGREICKQLRLSGAKVVVGTRKESNTQGTERKARLHEMHSREHWLPVLDGVDVVVNAVGILRQRRGETFEQVHHQAVSFLAEACAAKAIRLVHLSALGLENPLRSRFSVSKRTGEWALMNSDADWHIVRASLVDGEQGYGAGWFRTLAAWPVHFVPANANGVIAPIRVEDLAECMARVALDSNLSAWPGADRVFDVAGDLRLDIKDYLAQLKGCKPYAVIRVPAWLTRMCSHLFDVLHWTPLSFGHYELLKRHNCPKHDRTMELLQERPRPIQASVGKTRKPLAGIKLPTA